MAELSRLLLIHTHTHTYTYTHTHTHTHTHRERISTHPDSIGQHDEGELKPVLRLEGEVRLVPLLLPPLPALPRVAHHLALREARVEVEGDVVTLRVLSALKVDGKPGTHTQTDTYTHTHTQTRTHARAQTHAYTLKNTIFSFQKS